MVIDGMFKLRCVLCVCVLERLTHFCNSLRSGRLCGVVVRVPGNKSRGLGSIPGAPRSFCEVMSLERGPLSLVSTIEDLLGRKGSGFGL
jgi:hypothetical protein